MINIDPYGPDPFERIAVPKEHKPTEIERLVATAMSANLPEIANKLAEQAAALEAARNQCTALRAQLSATLDELQTTHVLLRKAVKELADQEEKALQEAQEAQARRNEPPGYLDAPKA